MSHCEIYNTHFFSRKVPVFGAWRQAPHVQRDSVGTSLETAGMFEAAWGACVVTDDGFGVDTGKADTHRDQRNQTD